MQATDTPLPLLRFIPYRREDVMAMCRDRGALAPAELSRFEGAAEQITQHFRDEFHGLRQAIKSAYAPLDPDADTRAVELAQSGQDENLASSAA